MSRYDDLIPAKSEPSSTLNTTVPTQVIAIQTPQARTTSRYGDLIPAPQAPTPEEPGFFESVKSFFTRKKEAPASTVEPTPTPTKAGRYQDLIPAPVVPETPQPTFLERAISSLAPEKKQPTVEPKTTLGTTIDTKTKMPVSDFYVSSAPSPSFMDKITKIVTAPFVKGKEEIADREAVVNSIVGTIDDQKYADIGKSLGLDKTISVKFPPGIDPKTADTVTRDYYTNKTIASYVKQNFGTLSKQYHYVDDTGAQKNIEKPIATDPSVVDKNLADFTKALGVRGVPTSGEVVGGVLMLPVVTGLISNPIAVVIGIAGWEALSAVEHSITGGSDLSKVIADKLNLNQPTSDALDLLELFAKGKALHSIYKKAPGVAEQFIKNTTTTYNMDKNVYIDPAKVKDIFQTGTKISAEENALIRSLGLDAKGYKDAIQNGITIKVPAEKLVTITDKPYWAKFKEAIGNAPSEPAVTRTTIGGEQKPTVGPRALIEAPKGPIETIPTPAPIAESYKPVVTPRGTVLPPEAPIVLPTVPKTSLYSDLIPSVEQKPTVAVPTKEIGVPLVVPPTIEEITTEKRPQEQIAQKEESVRAIYRSTGPSSVGAEFTKADEELSNLTIEMELSKAGERIFVPAEIGGGTEVRGIPSTFPEWVPEDLRSTDLFNEVIGSLQKLETVKYPEGNRPKQRALIDAVFDQLDVRLGVDTSHLRNAILESHGKITEQRATAKASGGGTTGGERPGGAGKAEQVAEPKTVKTKKGTYTVEEKPVTTEKIKGPTSGNFSIGTFRDGTTPLELGGVDKVKVIELPEMVQLARELMGEVPKIREKVSRHFGGEARGVFIGKGGGEIRLRADLFDPKVSSIDQAAKTLAHEIGHLTDYLPNLTLKRGNLMGRLLTLSDFRKDFLPEAGQSRTNKEIRQQLWDLSKYWRPLEETTADSSFLAYRKSAKELYADFISVLFNDPKLAADMAPTAYNLFFEHLDKKPLVRDAYFEAQALLSGDRMEVIKARRAGVQQMFKEGDYKAIELQNEKMKEREKRNNDLIFKTKFELIDKNAPLIDRVKELEKKGVIINPDDNPVYYLEERNYLGGKIKAIMETDFSPIYQNLNKAGIAWGTFGEELFYQRIIAGDRSSQANPRGITPSAAKELHDNLINEMTPEQVKVLTDGTTRFRDGLRKIADEAFKEGLYTPELYKQMQENPAYVTFQVIDHLENAMTSKVYKSIGTLKDITNPADASILKMLATVHAIERNKVTRTTVEFLKEHYPLEIEDAKTVFNGTNGRRFIDSKQPYNDTVIFYRNGKTEGYYVDSYIKKSIDNESVGNTFAIITGLKFMNSHLYRPLFIGFNLGFQSFNFVRDFKRFYKNIPDMTILRAIQRYHEAYPLARTRAFGPKTDREGNLLPKYEKAVAELTQLERDRVFSVTFNDVLAGATEDEVQIERILRTSGIDTFADPKVRHAALKPFVHVLEFIKRLGDLIETLPKAAGYYELASKKTGPLTKEETSYIRKNIGSPDFLAGGHLKPATNEIFLFSNAITQGIRSDYNVATNPKTRSAYWWKTMKIDILPKLLMLAAGVGMFGEEIKKIMEDASEYDKTNYTIIPLGTDSTGKSIYFRMPSDEGGRLIGGLFWKIINASNNEQPITKDLTDIISFASGQIPNVSPTITTAKTTFDYLSGQNPYDSFRGRNVLSDDVYKAGGWRANKAFLGWTFNQVGGGIFYRFSSEQAVPKEQGPAEKLFNLPVVGNILGRFFRVTDYGTQEHLAKLREQVQSEEAKQRLSEIDAVNDMVREAQQDKNLGANRRKYELKLVSDFFGHTARTEEEIKTAKRLIDRFRTSIQKGGGGAEMNALINSTSNEQKVTVLREIKKNMTPEEFQTFKKEVLHNRITTPEVFHNAEQ